MKTLILVLSISLQASAQDVMTGGPLGDFMKSYNCHDFAEGKNAIKKLVGMADEGCIELCEKERQILMAKGFGTQCGMGAAISANNTNRKCENFEDRRLVHNLFASCYNSKTVKVEDLNVGSNSKENAGSKPAKVTDTLASSTVETATVKTNCLIQVTEPKGKRSDFQLAAPSEFDCMRMAFTKCGSASNKLYYSLTTKTNDILIQELSCKEKQCCFGVPDTLRPKDAKYYQELRDPSGRPARTSSLVCEVNCGNICSAYPKYSYWITNLSGLGDVRACKQGSTGTRPARGPSAP